MSLSFTRSALADSGPSLPPLPNLKKGPFGTDERQNSYEDITHYNNYYEFGTDKTDPGANASAFPTRPWKIAFEGEIKHPQSVEVDELLKWFPLEERIYRMRCVEAWSMVIPWDGYSLSEFINFCEPLPSAKYVQFISLKDTKQMPNLPFGYDWPYKEGLRMDEARAGRERQGGPGEGAGKRQE